MARKSEFEPSDDQRLFNSAECCLLLYHCLEDIPYTAVSDSNISNTYYNRSSHTQSAVQELCGCELKQGKGFLSALQLSKPPILEEVYPLHEESECEALMSMLKWSLLPNLSLDIQRIRNYFGNYYWTYICAVNSLTQYVLPVHMWLMQGGWLREMAWSRINHCMHKWGLH